MSDLASHRVRTGATVVVLVIAAAVGLALASAVRAESPSPAADETVTLRIGWVQEPDNLNPFIGIQLSSFLMWHLNYDFLVGFDDKTMEPRPELATAWEVSDDGTEWTFTVRSDAMWHDGEPVTARDVAFTFDYIRDNELLNFATETDGILDAEAVDDTTLRVVTDGPKSNMLRMVCPILPEHIWSGVSGDEAAASFQNPPPIVGSGPFQVVEWQKGKFVRLKANEGYWAGAPKIDELIFQLYTNPDTMVTDLELGTVDGAIEVPFARFEGLAAAPGIEANEATSWTFVPLAMLCYDSPDSKGNPALLEERFRQAVNWAFDREKVVEVAYQGFATVGSTLIVPYSEYHWEPPAESAFTYDPERANAILDEAGYADIDGDGYRETRDGEKLTLRFYATTDMPQNQTAGKLIVGWLKDVGVRLDFQVIDAGTLIDYEYEYTGDVYTPNWDMWIWYWTQGVDPNFMVDIYTPEQIEGWNDCLWTDPEYTALNRQQKRTIDPVERIAIIQRMQEIFYTQAPYAILCYPYLLEAYDVEGWEGWVHFPGNAIGEQSGAVLYSYNNIDTYRLVQPTTTVEEGAGGGTTGLIVGLVIAALVIAAVVAVVLRRGRQKAEVV